MPRPRVVDGRARGVGGDPGLLGAPGRLGGGGLRGGQVVERGLRVLAPGGQVGLEVVGAGVEVGEAGRELPDLGGARRSPASRLRASAPSPGSAGGGAAAAVPVPASSAPTTRRTEQRGSSPSHQTPSEPPESALPGRAG